MVKDVSWTIETGYETMTIAGLAGTPDFSVGNEIDVTFVFEGNQQTTYETLREYAEFLYDGAVEFDTDYRDVPYFKQYLHPQAPLQTYLWKLTPNNPIDGFNGWWVVVTDINDDTLYQSNPRRVSTTMFILAPVTEGGRTLMRNRYEVE